jgi:hypothetical protein
MMVVQPPPPVRAIMKDAPWQGNAPFGAGPRAHAGLVDAAHRRGAANSTGYARRHFMQQRHLSIDSITPAPTDAADARTLGLPPLHEHMPTEWTSTAPQATERMKRPASDWVAWLIALAVLLYMAAFGFQAMTWTLRGGWNWLWLAVGPPVFGVFAVSAVRLAVERVRERRRIRVALQNMSLERGEGFRVGEPLALRLRAAVAEAAKDDERTVPPERITVRLMRRFVRSEADGTRTLVDECRGQAVALREDERDGRLRYTCEVCARVEPADEAAAQWWLALHDPAAEHGEPFMVAALRLLPAR